MPPRALVLGCALLSAAALDGCKTQDMQPVDTDIWRGTLDPFNRSVDIVFVIDDSSDMALAQDNLIRNFPAFMEKVQHGPTGPRGVHVAVLSPDLGAGGLAGCDDDSNGVHVVGEEAIFQHTPRGTCTATHLNHGATFLVNAGGQANYTGAVEDVFSCIARLGESGCGFNRQFGALQRALGADDRAPPIENAGFLRDEAALAIVMLTNEDDCSPVPGVPLFDSASNTNMASQLGPPTHFRCNEFGHRCPGDVAAVGSGRPDRNAPNNDVNATVSYDTCTSNDTDGYLLSTRETANRIKALKPDPIQAIVASIQGSPKPYTVHWTNPPSTDTSCGAASCPWPEITHACTASDGRYGDPGVRTAQFAQEFGNNGLVTSVCDGSFGPGLDRVAAAIDRVLGTVCISAGVPLNAAGEPSCTVTPRDGTTAPQPIPSCAASDGVAPCWRLLQTPSCRTGQALEISVDPNAPQVYSFDCGK